MGGLIQEEPPNTNKAMIDRTGQLGSDVDKLGLRGPAVFEMKVELGTSNEEATAFIVILFNVFVNPFDGHALCAAGLSTSLSVFASCSTRKDSP